MKTIKLNEGQFTMLKKIVESTVHDNEGNPKYGHMPIGDELKLFPQNGWGSEAMAGSNRIRR